MIHPADTYEGQTIHYNGHSYTITEGPEFENASIAFAVNERHQETMLFLKLDDNGDIIRAATRKGSWQDVTVTRWHFDEHNCCTACGQHLSDPHAPQCPARQDQQANLPAGN